MKLSEIGSFVHLQDGVSLWKLTNGACVRLQGAIQVKVSTFPSLLLSFIDWLVFPHHFPVTLIVWIEILLSGVFSHVDYNSIDSHTVVLFRA